MLNVVSGPPPLDDMSEFVKKLSGNQVQFDKVQVSQQTSTTEVRNIAHFSILQDSITHYTMVVVKPQLRSCRTFKTEHAVWFLD